MPLLNQSRQREPLRGLLMAEAERLAKDAAHNLFLAEHVAGQASGVLEANENLALLDALRPRLRATAGASAGTQRRDRARVGYLQQTGQADQALELLRQLAESLPHDVSIQQQYARALFDRGEYDAAYAWLRKVIAPEARWLPHEEESLRVTYTDLLWQQGRFPDLVEYLDGWVRQDPANQNAYARYLSSLVRTDQEARANELAAKWLADGRQPDKLKDAVAARLEAAINFALGQGHDLYHQRIDERWHQPLAETAEFLATHPSHAQFADRIMSDWRFTPTDACRQVRRTIVIRLVRDIERLPAERLSSLVSWVLPNDPAVEQPQWRKIAEGLERRWAAEPDPRIKNQLASPLLQILSARLTAEEHLKFLRRQLAEGPQVHRANFARQLFDALLSQPWSEELEREAFSLLPGLSDAEDPAERLQAQVAALVRLTDGMVQARNAALMARVEHPENLTRTELRAKQQANLRTAREQFADRLQQSTAGLPEALAPWIEIEVLHLNVLLGRDLDKVREACWERLGARPQPLSDTDPIQAELDDLLRHRRLVIVAYLATRRSAAPADAQRLLAYLDRGIETAGEDGERFAWQMFKYQLLVALDRPQELEQVLSTWIKPQDADNDWRRSLAYLQAEQARLREAIALLEQVEAADELLPADYRALGRLVPSHRRPGPPRAGADRVVQGDRGVAAEQLAVRATAPLATAGGPDPGRIESGRSAGVRGPVSEVGTAAELPRAAARILPLDPRFPPAVRPGRRGNRPHGGQGLSVPARHATGAGRGARRSHRRFAGRTHRGGPPAGQDGRRPAGLGSAGTAGRTPQQRGPEPARTACRTGAGRHATGVSAGVVGGRAAAGGRFAGRLGPHRAEAAGRRAAAASWRPCISSPPRRHRPPPRRNPTRAGAPLRSRVWQPARSTACTSATRWPAPIGATTGTRTRSTCWKACWRNSARPATAC